MWPEVALIVPMQDHEKHRRRKLGACRLAAMLGRAMDDKIIVSNSAALKDNGSVGLGKIKTAVNNLIASDQKRGIKSRFVFIDDAVAMKSFKGSAVDDATSQRQNKKPSMPFSVSPIRNI